jgi:5-methylcytosine-specific restriction endonuclease McrA
MFPKPPRTELKARKPIQRTRVRTKRAKARPGRVRGKQLVQLRKECFERDRFQCVACGSGVTWESGEMAHVGAKRRYGDNLSNVRTKCFRCHRIIEHCNGGVEKVVPTK